MTEHIFKSSDTMKETASKFECFENLNPMYASRGWNCCSHFVCFMNKFPMQKLSSNPDEMKECNKQIQTVIWLFFSDEPLLQVRELKVRLNVHWGLELVPVKNFVDRPNCSSLAFQYKDGQWRTLPWLPHKNETTGGWFQSNGFFD